MFCAYRLFGGVSSRSLTRNLLLVSIILMADTAIVNGKIEEPKESSITAQDAKNLGVCIGNVGDGESSSSNEQSWQIIDEEQEDQSAVTIWRPLQRWPLENARNGTVSLVELKPKTGRYHRK